MAAPEPVGPTADFLARLIADAGPGGTALLGVDFPLGLPRAHAAAAGVTRFTDALDAFGHGAFASFYDPAAAPDEISPHRPFYPARPGGSRRAHLIDGLGLTECAALSRACDRATIARRAGSPLFWTMGSQQVGKAAIAGWRDMLVPARRAGLPVHLWPFDGTLGDLLARPGVVVAETYPAEMYVHLGLSIRLSGRSKRRTADRRADAAGLKAWARSRGVGLSRPLAQQIADGFGAARDGEDRFDATVALLGMLDIVDGRRPAHDPEEPVLRHVEGWVLGLDPAELQAGSGPADRQE